ncbi:MAG TPA: DUF4175 domain-containing protein [Bacteroidia bacterium]|jgi:hypothetical protein|nr:DUF4175 domain-containing protein [Bacteroidia bacterium]
MNYQEDILIRKLDEFIRKYYKNQLIKGGLYATGLVFASYLLVVVLEYYAHFDMGIRTVLFYSLLLAIGGVCARYIALPLFRLNRIGPVISNEQAAAIIGTHFSEVKDKLLNVLQLKKVSEQGPTGAANSGSHELLEASINQKIKELKPIPFTAAIDLGQNRRYLKYALAPVVIILFLVFSAPSMLTESTKRLVNHNRFYEKQAPFQFHILNPEMKTIEQQDFPLEVKVSGEEIPATISLLVNGNEYKLSRDNIVHFTYLFKNLQHDTKFRLSADGFTSAEYQIRVLPNPVLLNFDIRLEYPAYIGKKSEVLRNTGDLVIPAGTRVAWSFNTKDTRKLRISFSDSAFALNPAANTCSYSKRFLNSNSYSVTTSNEFIRSRDSVVYAIQVIPDLFPSIQVEERKDTLSDQHLYYRGEVKDDYGFNALSFDYKLLRAADSAHTGNTAAEKLESVKIPVTQTLTQDQFMYFWDISKLNLGPGDQIEYYFEVWDNDGVHGPKSTRSQKMLFKAPTLKELAEKSETSSQAVKSDITESIQKAKELQKDIDALHKKVLEKKSLSWEDRKKIQDLLDKQKKLENNVEQFKQENEKSQKEQSDYRKNDEQLLEKQKQIQELFDQVLTDDMKKQMKELEKLMQTMDKDKMQEQLEKMKLSNKDLEKELDRTLELFKQLEFDKKLTDTKERLDKLADNQQKLSEQTDKKNADSKELENKQEQLNKEFEDIQKELKDLQKKNDDLEKPHDEFKKTEEQEQKIKEDMNESHQELQKNQKSKASKSQKAAAQKMQELSQKMSSMQNQMEQDQGEEDLNSLRQILQNLVHLSFDQEALMVELGKTRVDNPKYLQIPRKQNQLKDNAKMIEDSLFALSKRNPQIGTKVNQEISAINSNMDKATANLAERNTGEASSRQQFAMTSVNNLALMLNEALNSMEQDSKKGKPGSGSCNKPGGKGQKPSAASMRAMQQKLNQKMGEMMQKMKEGKGQGRQSGMSEEFARMAAQQEAIREMLQKMADQLKKDGKGGGSLGNTAEKMDQTETDLVNKRITQETLKRQQDILTKMLDYEKAEKEREMDTERKADQPKNQEFSNPNAFSEYQKLKAREVELLKTVPPSLSPYYKSKVSEYFNSFEEK